MSAELDQVDEACKATHSALQGFLDEGELPVSWVLTIEVVGPDGVRYLAHRAGGGHDGTERPMAWTYLGMAQASAELAKDQLLGMAYVPDDDEEEGEPA